MKISNRLDIRMCVKDDPNETLPMVAQVRFDIEEPEFITFGFPMALGGVRMLYLPYPRQHVIRALNSVTDAPAKDIVVTASGEKMVRVMMSHKTDSDEMVTRHCLIPCPVLQAFIARTIELIPDEESFDRQLQELIPPPA
jgi:hypothetical protein